MELRGSVEIEVNIVVCNILFYCFPDFKQPESFPPPKNSYFDQNLEDSFYAHQQPAGGYMDFNPRPQMYEEKVDTKPKEPEVKEKPKNSWIFTEDNKGMV